MHLSGTNQQTISSMNLLFPPKLEVRILIIIQVTDFGLRKIYSVNPWVRSYITNRQAINRCNQYGRLRALFY